MKREPEVEAEAESPERGRGEALAKAIGREASGGTGQGQQGRCLGLLVGLGRHTQGLVEDGIDEVAAG